MLAVALCAGSIPCASQDGERPSVRNVSPPKVIRTYRPRIGADFFKQDAVRFERARVDMSGSILADGHNLNLYGAVLEHVPPQLNQGDSRGAEDGRGYRH